MLLISGKNNPADDLTKIYKWNGTSAEILTTSKFDPTLVKWVNRDLERVETSHRIQKEAPLVSKLNWKMWLVRIF